MDRDLISTPLTDVRHFDASLLQKLADAGYKYAEDFAYRSYQDLTMKFGNILTEDELAITLSDVTQHATFMRIQGITDDIAAALRAHYTQITSLPYMALDHLKSQIIKTVPEITELDVMTIQRNAAIFLKSGKLVFTCQDQDGNALNDLTISIPFPTEENLNKYYSFYPNEAGDVYIENIEFGMHDLYIRYQGDDYRYQITLLPDHINRYHLTLHDSMKIKNSNEFTDGFSHKELPEISYNMTQDELQDGESFSVLRLSENDVTLLADYRIQSGCVWHVRSLKLAISNFDFDLDIGTSVTYDQGQWTENAAQE